MKNCGNVLLLDIKKGFKLFKKGDAVIDEDNKEENKYLVDVYIDSNNEFYTIRISISKIFNKIKLSAEDKENGSWSFEFKAAESTIFIMKSITIDTKLFNTGAPVVIVR